MNQDHATLAKTKEAAPRLSVALPAEIHEEVAARAEENNMSLNRTILQLIRAGLEAERQKKERLETMLRRYRECADPNEAERLAEELGAMIFGR
ncbi:MAG TPA: Arc family DNA-binding protein [Bryobacteraceae bacterium]|nr:Arc family DNA-binding protein [Bryobacteraceae bacterium]